MKMVSKERGFIEIRLNKRERELFERVWDRLPNMDAHVIASAIHEDALHTLAYDIDGKLGAEMCPFKEGNSTGIEFDTDIHRMPTPDKLSYYLTGLIIQNKFHMISSRNYETKVRRVLKFIIRLEKTRRFSGGGLIPPSHLVRKLIDLRF